MIFEGGRSRWDRPAPGKSNGKCVLMFHGWSRWVKDFDKITHNLVKEGYSVYRPRLFGHATTDSSRTALMNAERWHVDTKTAMNVVKANFADEDIVVAGASMGAVLAMSIAAEYDGKIAGLMLISPAILARSKLMWLSPILGLFNFDIRTSSNRFRMSGNYETWAMNDLYRYKLSTRMAFSLLRVQLKMLVSGFVLRHTPTLLISCSDDDVVDCKFSTKWICKRVVSLTDRIYLSGGHAIESNCMWARTSEEIMDWLCRHA